MNSKIKLVIVWFFVLSFVAICIKLIIPRKEHPPIDYQQTIDSLKIEIAIRESQINDQLFVIEDLEQQKKEVVKVHTRTITKYKTIPTPARVQQLAERL